MTKIQKSVSFTNAYIDLENDAMDIVEQDKNGDDVCRYSVMNLLRDWEGVLGLSISIKSSDDLASGDGL